MPTATIVILQHQETDIETLKKEWGVRGNTDVCMRIIEEYLKQRRKKPKNE